MGRERNHIMESSSEAGVIWGDPRLFDTTVLEYKYPATACGIDPYDGLIVAYLPKFAAVMDEHWLAARLTLYCVNGQAIDAIDDERGQRVKWWQVRNAASSVGMQYVEPIWQGPAGEFMLKCLPDVPRPSPEHTLHMRAYSHGPWIRLENKDEKGGDPEVVSHD